MTSQRASSRSGPVRGSRAHGGLGWRGARAACPAKRDERLVGHVGTLSLMISSPSFLLRFPLPDALVRRMAIHEARHAAVGLAIDAGEISSVSISISAARRREGRRETEFYSKCLGFERTGAQMLDDMAVRPGGLAAEEDFLGDRSAGVAARRGRTYTGLRPPRLPSRPPTALGKALLTFRRAMRKSFLPRCDTTAICSCGWTRCSPDSSSAPRKSKRGIDRRWSLSRRRCWRRVRSRVLSCVIYRASSLG